MTKTTLRALNYCEVYKIPYHIIILNCAIAEVELYYKYKEYPKNIFLLININYDKKN